MTDPADAVRHPSPDDLADLREGLLDGAAAREVTAHVDDCADCRAELAALDEVAALLADEGAVGVSMPADVAARLDDALARAAAERSAGIPSLAERRSSLATRSFRWLGAAAAVVIVGYGAVTVLDDGVGGGSADQSSAGDIASLEAGDSAGGDTADSPTAPEKGSDDYQRLAPQRLDRGTLSSYADALSGRAEILPRPNNTVDTQAFRERCVVPRSKPPVTAAPVRWKHRLAYVVVNTETRVATVYACETPPERLYSTPY